MDILKTDGTQEVIVEGQETTESKSYTEAEVLEMLQKETDRRVTAALKTQEDKFKSKIDEATKLSQMDESQKKTYEFEQRVKELESKEKEFSLMKNKIEAQKVLSSRGLPIEFVDYIVAEDAETMMERIEMFDKNFKAAVNDAVSKKITNPTPKLGSSTQTGLTPETFKAMSIAEQSELYRTNPTLYKELMHK